jgi:hypothetical protein
MVLNLVHTPTECTDCPLEERYDSTGMLELSSENGFLTIPCKVVGDRVLLYRLEKTPFCCGEIVNLAEISNTIPLPEFFSQKSGGSCSCTERERTDFN